MHTITLYCSLPASWTLPLEFYRMIQEYVILQWKQAALMLELHSWIRSNNLKRSSPPQTSKNRYLYMPSPRTCTLFKQQLGERWAVSHFFHLIVLIMLDSYGSPVYTVCTTGRWWAGLIFLWRPTHPSSQVRVIAGELVSNGFLADENLLTCSSRVSS